MDVVNYLLGYENIKIVQNTEMFNFSLDSVLLPNFVTLNKNINKILDIGCGNGVIPLILSTKTNAKIIGIEIQKEVAVLANKSIAINKLENQIQIINEDVNTWYKKIDNEEFDIITCNPPFFKINELSNVNDSIYKTIARHEIKLNLEQILIISRKLLKNNGILSMVHRPERLLDIIVEMRKNNIEPKKIQFIYPKEGMDANILLIEGRKNGKPGLKIMAPIYTHNENGTYTDQVTKFFS